MDWGLLGAVGKGAQIYGGHKREQGLLSQAKNDKIVGRGENGEMITQADLLSGYKGKVLPIAETVEKPDLFYDPQGNQVWAKPSVAAAQNLTPANVKMQQDSQAAQQKRFDAQQKPKPQLFYKKDGTLAYVPEGDAAEQGFLTEAAYNRKQAAVAKGQEIVGIDPVTKKPVTREQVRSGQYSGGQPLPLLKTSAKTQTADKWTRKDKNQYIKLRNKLLNDMIKVGGTDDKYHINQTVSRDDHPIPQQYVADNLNAIPNEDGHHHRIKIEVKHPEMVDRVTKKTIPAGWREVSREEADDVFFDSKVRWSIADAKREAPAKAAKAVVYDLLSSHGPSLKAPKKTGDEALADAMALKNQKLKSNHGPSAPGGGAAVPSLTDIFNGGKNSGDKVAETDVPPAPQKPGGQPQAVRLQPLAVNPDQPGILGNFAKLQGRLQDQSAGSYPAVGKPATLDFDFNPRRQQYDAAGFRKALPALQEQYPGLSVQELLEIYRKQS